MSDKAKEICKMLGCSGMNSKCPGNDYCGIIIKVKGYPKKKEVKE